MAGRQWTQEEDQYIIDNYYNKTIPEIGKVINRTTSSVMNRVSKLDLARKRIPVDIEINKEINRLTLLEKFYNKGIRFGRFRCICGNIKETTIWSVFNGITRSCGCLKTEMDKQKIIERCTTHGMSDTIEHNTWLGIKNRCYNKNNRDYKNYGGRGIHMSKEWLDSFQNFYEDMGPKPEPKDKYHIGRKDHFDDYCKNNCRWITDEEEMIDSDNNRHLIAFNKIKTLLHWCREKKCKCNIDILKYRLYELGWSPEKSLTTVVYEG